MMLRASLLMFFTCLAAVVAAPSAQAACTASATVNFGNVDLSSGSSFDQTGSLNVSCTGLTPLTNYRVCPVISGTRQMNRLPETGSIDFDLYSDTPGGSVWGTTSPEFAMTTDVSGNGSLSNVNVFGRIFSGQSTTPTSTGASQYSVQLTISVDATISAVFPSCAGQFDGGGTATVSANYPPVCNITTNTLDFGSLTTTSSGSNAQTTIEATCTVGSLYSITLDYGLSGIDPTYRIMTSGANQLIYGIYQDAGLTQPWGFTETVNNLPGTGTGSPQTITAYGNIRPQTTPPAGVYTDIVAVTITY